MKLTNAQISDLSNGLAEFDEIKQPILNDKREVVGHETQMPHDITWKGAYAMGRTCDAIKTQAARIVQSRTRIIAQHTGGLGIITPSHANYVDCMKELDALMETEADVEVHQTAIAELKTDKNQYSPSTIARIRPLLSDWSNA